MDDAERQPSYVTTMTGWTIHTLRDLDRRYAEEGVHPHQRSFRAAVDILGDKFAMGAGGRSDYGRLPRRRLRPSRAGGADRARGGAQCRSRRGAGAGAAGAGAARAARARVLRARAQLGIARAAMLPVVTTSAGISRTHTDNSGGPLFNFSEGFAGIDVSYDLDLFGEQRFDVDCNEAGHADTPERHSLTITRLPDGEPVTQ
jgi:hypothetical protein